SEPQALHEQQQEQNAGEGAQTQPLGGGFLARMRAGLAKSSQALSGGLVSIFTKKKLDEATLEALEELLITADMGVKVASDITARLAREKVDKDVTPDEVRALMGEHIERILAPVARPL